MTATPARRRLRTHPGDRDAPGFTLLEVVLALVIFSLLAVMAYGAFHLGHRAVVKGERQAAINQRVRLAGEIMARQIRSAVFYYARFEDDSYPFFTGTSDQLTFVSAAPQSRGGTGLVEVTYRARDGRLVLEERVGFSPRDLYEPSADAVRAQRAVLLEDFSALQFEFLPYEETDAWQRAWDGREEEALPALVRVTIEGLEFFEFHPWVQEVPLMTVTYGWGADEFLEAPEQDDDDLSFDDDDDFGDQPNPDDFGDRPNLVDE